MLMAQENVTQFGKDSFVTYREATVAAAVLIMRDVLAGAGQKFLGGRADRDGQWLNEIRVGGCLELSVFAACHPPKNLAICSRNSRIQASRAVTAICCRATVQATSGPKKTAMIATASDRIEITDWIIPAGLLLRQLPAGGPDALIVRLPATGRRCATVAHLIPLIPLAYSSGSSSAAAISSSPTRS
jgi:hypothetical protein